MTSSIVEFWRQSSGAIHPADADILATVPNLFNLDFPPPAYVGDIENAPVILLNGNGGYTAETKLEFLDAASIDRAIDRLHNPAAIDPINVCSYYAQANYAGWFNSGELAMVNAVAYRAPEITKDVHRIAKILPSTLLHIRWLKEEVITAAEKGLRLVIAHRNGLWSLKRIDEPQGVHFTSNARSKHLPSETLEVIQQFLSQRS
jgi:hypothetical protein